MVRLVLLLCVAASAAGPAKCEPSAQPQYKPCPAYPDTGLLIDAIIGNCTPGDTCVIPVGSNQSFQIDFSPGDDSDTLEVDIYGVIPGVPVPLPFVTFDTNGCNPTYNIHCPLVKNKRYTYRNSVIVPGYKTPFSLKGMFQMLDLKQQTIICFMVDVLVVAVSSNEDQRPTTDTENLIA